MVSEADDPRPIFGDCQLLRLRELGFVILLTTLSNIFLARRDAKFRRRGEDGLIAGLILDLDFCLRKFAALLGSEREFTTEQFSARVGITRQCVELWLQAGHIRPSIREGSGANDTSDRGRRFNHVDLFVACTAKTMRRHGVPAPQILRATKALYQWLQTPADALDDSVEKEQMCFVN